MWCMCEVCGVCVHVHTCMWEGVKWELAACSIVLRKHVVRPKSREDWTEEVSKQQTTNSTGEPYGCGANSVKSHESWGTSSASRLWDSVDRLACGHLFPSAPWARASPAEVPHPMQTKARAPFEQANQHQVLCKAQHSCHHLCYPSRGKCQTGTRLDLISPHLQAPYLANGIWADPQDPMTRSEPTVPLLLGSALVQILSPTAQRGDAVSPK